MIIAVKSLILLVLLIARPEDDIPERRADSEPCLFPAEVVLVVVLLQPVEVALGVLGSIDVVQRVVADVVRHVPDQEEGPEDCGQDGVTDHDDLGHGLKSDDEGANCQEGWVNQSVSGQNDDYGSLGSMWWMPCMMQCKYRTSLLLGRQLSEWKTNRCRQYSVSVKKRKPITAVRTESGRLKPWYEGILQNMQEMTSRGSRMMEYHLLWEKNSTKSDWNILGEGTKSQCGELMIFMQLCSSRSQICGRSGSSGRMMRAISFLKEPMTMELAMMSVSGW